MERTAPAEGIDESELFDEDFLAKLQHLSLISSHLRPGHMKGEHRAKRTGAGLEFADYRFYAPGDDTRDLDWRIFFRLDRLILRLFEEEADLPIYIFLDSSRSMAFSDPPKFDYARKIAAALCYLGLLNLDRVSLIAYGGDVVRELASTRGRDQIWRALRFLGSLRPDGDSTSLQASLRTYFKVSRRRGVVISVSDFLDQQGFETSFQRLRYLRQEAFAIQVFGVDEESPSSALGDEVLLQDSEDGSIQRLRPTPAILKEYRNAFDRHSRELESLCRRYGWGFVRARTEIPFEDLILRILRRQAIQRRS